MTATTSSTIPEFADVIWEDVVPPERHPGFQYEGFSPGKVVNLTRGHILRPGYGAFRRDVTLEVDVKVPMRDGVSIYANVFRPTDASKLPAIICWSPYGKSSGGVAPQNYDAMGPYRMGIDYQRLSGYETFEGPNPAEWCARDYVVVDPDARGACHSEGDIVFFGQQEAFDIYDLIEWITKQPWCDGNVVMMGNSWLAIAQINHASRCRHPALRAIAPWEAMTDLYKDSTAHGGIPDAFDFGKIITKGFAGLSRAENAPSTIRNRPLFDDYWESKVIEIKNLEIPMYLTASYSSRLHCRGSFATFDGAPSKNKWLRVHATQEWHDIYKKENMDDLQKFFDFFAKGQLDNGWNHTPQLRLSLIGYSGSVVDSIIERPEEGATFPLARTKHLKYYLDSSTMSASQTPPSASGTAKYESHSLTDRMAFSVTFDKYTELSGIPWVKLFVSCKEKDDLDIHILLQKTGISGELLEHANYPMPVPIQQIPNANVPKFQGPFGALRASHHVSQIRKDSPDDIPQYTHRCRESVQPGSVIALEIPIWPIGMVFGPGEGLSIMIAGHDMRFPEFPIEMKEPLDQNVGQHVVHTGGEHDSFIVLPFIS